MLIHIDNTKFKVKPTGPEIGGIKSRFTKSASIKDMTVKEIADFSRLSSRISCHRYCLDFSWRWPCPWTILLFPTLQKEQASTHCPHWFTVNWNVVSSQSCMRCPHWFLQWFSWFCSAWTIFHAFPRRDSKSRWKHTSEHKDWACKNYFDIKLRWSRWKKG